MVDNSRREQLTTTPTPSPQILVLRRSGIRRFIDSPPAQRYEELRGFIDVELVERSEDALREIVRDVRRDYDESVRQQAEGEEQLQSVWEAEGSLSTSKEDWARGVARQDVVVLAAEADALRQVADDLRGAEAALANYASALQTALEHERELATAQQEVEAIEASTSQREGDLVSILTGVRAYLQPAADPNECPVCLQSISLEDLRTSLEKRLQEHEEHTAVRTARDRARTSHDGAARAAAMAGETLVASAARLLANVSAQTHDVIRRTGITGASYPLLSTHELANAPSIAEAEALLGTVLAIRTDINDAEQEATRLSGQVNAIRQLEKQVRESSEKSTQLESLATALSEAYDVARLTRLQFTQAILDEVTVECNRLYALVHPAESLELSRLALDERQRGSLLQSAKFEGHDNVVPQAYFSESHLDTLGFCYWLAIAKRENANRDAIVVLDDVFTSIDAPHLRRIAALIAEEATNFGHVIITTHQRQWRDIYRFQRGPGAITQLVELQSWTLAKGLSAYRTILAVAELAESLDATPFDRQITCSKAGILLEATLDHLALQYRCRVPRSHDGDFTLGELLDGTESLLKKLEVHRPDLDENKKPLAPPTYTSSKEVASIFANLRGLTFLRNQIGAHFNAPAADISDDDVRVFADLAVKLAKALGCEACGQVPGKDTGSHFKCSCKEPEEVRLLPLRN